MTGFAKILFFSSTKIRHFDSLRKLSLVFFITHGTKFLISLQSFTESLEDISPAQTYHANLDCAVFVPPCFVVIYSLNETFILFILVFLYPILSVFFFFCILLSLVCLSHLSFFTYRLLSLSTCVSFFLCLLFSLLTVFYLPALTFFFFLLISLSPSVSFYVSPVLYFLAVFHFVSLPVFYYIFLTLLFTFSCVYYYYYFPVLLFYIFYYISLGCFFCLFFCLFLSVLFLLLCFALFCFPNLFNYLFLILYFNYVLQLLSSFLFFL